jgi:hypothetical protein
VTDPERRAPTEIGQELLPLPATAVGDGAAEAAGVSSSAAASSSTAEPGHRPCAWCKQVLGPEAFDDASARNCKACRAKSAAKRAETGRVRVLKPEGWTPPKNGETPLKRCEVCRADLVWSAFPSPGSTICRNCVVDAKEGKPPQAAPGLEPKTEPAHGVRNGASEAAPDSAMPRSAGKKPTEYTSEIGHLVCDRVAAREPIYQICSDPAMPSERTLSAWRRTIPEFGEAYAQARTARADARADAIDQYIDMVRTGRLDPQQATVMINAEKWAASRERPSVYGDKVTADVQVTNVGPQAPANDRLLVLLRPYMGQAAPVPAIDVEALPPAEEGSS